MYEFVEFFKDMFKYIIIIVIIILLRIYVLTTTEVVGPSMQPNLKDGNIVLVDQISKRFKEYDRFDIIVLEHSPSYVIKRIIGLPGERIKYADNVLYINGEVKPDTSELIGDTTDFEEITIPENSYFVLGDNRENSTDSRVFGVISKKDIVGKPFFRFWPFNKISIVK